MKDRREVLFETFSKSNRIAIMWGLPFGVGMLLFAPDLVRFVIGPQWKPAVPLLQTMGLLLGIGQMGVSWRLFYQARGETRPLAVSAIVAVFSFAAFTAPLMALFGLTGLMVGLSVSVAGDLVVRAIYLRRLFAEFRPLRHLFRGVLPSLPAVGVVLVARIAYGGARTLELAVFEFVLYVAVTAAATGYFEWPLLRELAGYLRRDGGQGAVGATGPRELPA